MPGVKFTKEDVMSSKRIPPAWYKLLVKEFTEAKSKDGLSTNFVGQFAIDEGPLTSTPIRLYFNEQMMGRVMDFVRCFTKTQSDEELSKATEGHDVIDVLQQTVGRHVDGFARYDPERKWNTIDDFRARPAAQNAPAAVKA